MMGKRELLIQRTAHKFDTLDKSVRSLVFFDVLREAAQGIAGNNSRLHRA